MKVEPLMLRAGGVWALTTTLLGCATTPQALHLPEPLPHLVLLGEQHDAPEHQHLQAQAVREWSAQGRLAAVVIEMAERGYHTQNLPTSASEVDAQEALRWNNAGWPWAVYGPVVMAAVRAGVPVWGANLPRTELSDALRNAALDGRLPAPTWQKQQQAIQDGHCQLLPPSQVLPMTRVQVARDISMADVAAQVVPHPHHARPEQTVLLIAGAAHVQPSVGIPWFLPAGLSREVVVLPPDNRPRPDPCIELRERFKAGPKTP